MRAAAGHATLVQASLAEPAIARPAFAEWSRRVNVQALDYGTLRMLPLLARRDDLGEGPPAWPSGCAG